MEHITLQLEVAITAMDGRELPEQGRLVDQFTDYVYKYFIKDTAQVQTVQVTKINGKQLG